MYERSTKIRRHEFNERHGRVTAICIHCGIEAYARLISMNGAVDGKTISGYVVVFDKKGKAVTPGKVRCHERTHPGYSAKHGKWKFQLSRKEQAADAKE
jgi:hypothetical protein